MPRPMALCLAEAAVAPSKPAETAPF